MRPVLETINDSRAISAAPVSSTQPIPAAESTSQAPGDCNVGKVVAAGDQLSRLPQSSLAEPPDPDGLSIEFEVNGIAICAAPADPDRRGQHSLHRGLGTIGNVTLGHVARRSANPQFYIIPYSHDDV